MAIIGFNLHKIFVERKKTLTGKVSIRTNIDVKEVKKEEISLIKNQDVLSFDFEFTIKYDPEVASLIFGGNVLFTVNPKELKEVMGKWKKKEIPEEIRLVIFNYILSKCSIKALTLEEDMGLPTHLPLPRFTKQESGK
jgi:hypothetical protein